MKRNAKTVSNPVAIGIFSFLLMAFGWTPAFSIPVQVEQPVYDFLQRLTVEGVLDHSFLGSLPLQKDEVRKLLQYAWEDSSALSSWERGELNRYRREFEIDLYKQDSRLVYQDPDYSLLGRVEYFTGGYYQDSLPKPQAFAYGSFTPAFEGTLGKNLSFVSEASIAMERSHYPRFLLNYDPQRGLPYNTKKRKDDPNNLDNVATFDAFHTVISWWKENYGIEFGNDWNQWGPGIWEHPSFSAHPWFWVQDSMAANPAAGFEGSKTPGGYINGYRYPGEGPPLTQLRLTLSWKFMRYTKFYAQRTGLSSDTPAYVVAHRLEAQLGKNLNIGAYEMVSYSGRSLEFIYAIPFVPLKFAEHQLGDRDNAAMGFDASYNLFHNSRVYTELFIDDLLGPLDFLKNWWGNKFAWVLGGETYDLFLPASVFQIEYSRVEPWVFGHHIYNDQFQNFGSLLGSSLPANSQQLHVRWNKALSQKFDVGLEYWLLQRQQLDPGSSLFDVHVDSIDGIGKDFLGSNPETRQTFQFDANARFSRYVQIKGYLGYLMVENWKSRKGISLQTPTVGGEIYLRY